MTATEPIRETEGSGPIHELVTSRVPVAELHTFHRNPRRGDVDAIARSLAVQGQYRPIVVNRGTFTLRRNEVLAGNHTLMAARSLDWSHITVCWVDVDEDQAARIVAADNRTADLGDYDADVLADLLEGLDGLDGTGYTDDDLAAMLAADGENGEPEEAAPEAVPDEPPAVPVTKPGDVWLLGPHRIVCGDCRDPDVVASVVDGASVNLAFTSPPYASQRKYDPSSGFTPVRPDDFVEWFEPVQRNVLAHLADDGSWLVNIKEHCDGGQRSLYVKDLTLAHVRRWGWRLVDELCWVDTRNGVPGGWSNRFKNAWEPVFHYARTGEIKFRPLANGEHSEKVFSYSPNHQKSPRASRFIGSSTGRVGGFSEGLARPSNVIACAAETWSREHDAAFPSRLAQWFIGAYTDANDVVLDPFMGSGSTLVAAHQENRVALGVEISPGYCDVICRRFQRLTGTAPILARTGAAHDFLAEVT